MSGSSSSPPVLGNAHLAGAQPRDTELGSVVRVYRPDGETGRLNSVPAEPGMALQHGDILSANAFTTGVDVHFGSNTQTLLGRGLLAHELTHTVQQGQGSAPPNFEPVNNAYLQDSRE
ncbi:DUF4157 domain-containing protein [Roseomonas fluvialis]|uniref:eCIS core domain-containing protein n=1 Tax=Roseomonas fluvialis TaxID=1750527 RepID=A0ABN6NV47_9PROT|nr:DUF4157 domain-containing protein [Roseomonas fluvialis]BDG70318.1 hypothetical protein Rmf_02470 [Roseomonas fluvialis]